MNTVCSSQALIPRWIACLNLALPLLLQGGPESRVWTDLHGRRLEGSLATIGHTSIELVLSGDRRTVTVPRQLLCAEDQRYILIWEKVGLERDSSRWPAELGPLLNFTPKSEGSSTPGEWVYSTPNFRFCCDVELAPSLIKEYSLAFEGTFHAVRKLPLGLNPQPSQDKFIVRLMANRDDYLRAGAPKDSAGVYLIQSREILVPIDSLGVRTVGNRVAIDRKSHDTGTLVHEITHQVMHDWLNVLPVWFVEGFAEYMAAIPFNQGRFSFRDVDAGILKRLLEEQPFASARSGGLQVDLAPPDQIMGLTHQQWSAAVANGRNAALNYRSAMMLVYFFIHLDGNQDGSSLAAYLNLARAGQQEMQRFVATYNGAVENYNASLKSYNDSVTVYNDELLRFRKAVQEYNSRVRAYNSQLEKGTPEHKLIEVGPEPGPPPSPPRKPEMPTILARNNLNGGTLDLGQAEMKARDALTQMRSPVELWRQIAQALANRSLMIRAVNTVPGHSLSGYDSPKPAVGRK